MKKISQYELWLDQHTDLFLDLVRIYLGTGLFVKAIYLMGHRDYLLQIIDQAGTLWFAPIVIAHYIIPAHLLGGILLALGLLTRLAALAQIPILMGAVFYIYLPKVATLEPRQNLEFSALVLFLLALITVFGARRWSVDYYLSRKGTEPSRPVETAPSTV